MHTNFEYALEMLDRFALLAIPEPASAGLIGLAMLGLTFVRRRK